MRRLTLVLVILCAASLPCFGGSDGVSASDKDFIEGPEPPCGIYRPHEWEVDLWGAFASPWNSGHKSHFRAGDFDAGPVDMDNAPEHVDIGAWSNDRYLNRDRTWGGGLDLKYFFSPSMGVGLQGFMLDARDNNAGGGLATFTVRYPIGCSRAAPYAWAGLGATAGGSHTVRYFSERDLPNGNELESRANESVDNRQINLTTQLGVGLQFRVRPNVGFMADYAWNFLEHGDNDFGMFRFGVVFAY